MDIEKFTERSRGFLQAAQTIAIREFHQRITPEHLLKALLDDEEGAAAGLIRTAGGGPKIASSLVPAATKAGDDYVAQDRLLVALAASDTPAGKALREAGATPQALDKAVADIRK